MTGLDGVRGPWTGRNVRARWAFAALVLLLALTVRLAAARHAYPVPGDGGHFVQYGIELANGNPEGLSTYWSQGMVLLAAGGYKLGLDPGRCLQGAALLASLLVVVAVMSLALSIFGRWDRAIMAGLGVAVVPASVHYSVVGYSEMPFAGFMLCGLALYAKWIAPSRRPWGLVTGASVTLALSAYFKATDAVVVAGVVFLYGVVSGVVLKDRSLLSGAIGAAILFSCLMLPLCLFTLARDGQFAPGLKANQIALGDDWADSKKTYALEQPWKTREAYLRENGLPAYVWRYRGLVAAQWARNVVTSLRLLSGQIFVGPFRLGPAWFSALFVACACAAHGRGTLKAWLLPLLVMLVPLNLVCLCLVHDRLIIPSLFLVILLLSDGVSSLVGSTQARSLRLVCLLTFLLLVGKYAQLSLTAADREFGHWRYANMAAMGERLREVGTEDDILMAHGPALAIHFHKKHPFRTVEIPYASLADLENHAAANGVNLIVVSDETRPHWPIGGLFRGDPVPENWTLVQESRFAGDERKGTPAETYRVFRRTRI